MRIREGKRMRIRIHSPGSLCTSVTKTEDPQRTRVTLRVGFLWTSLKEAKDPQRTRVTLRVGSLLYIIDRKIWPKKSKDHVARRLVIPGHKNRTQKKSKDQFDQSNWWGISLVFKNLIYGWEICIGVVVGNIRQRVDTENNLKMAAKALKMSF